MSVYVIADVKVTDESWIPDYAAKAHEVVHRHGGKYLARSANLTTLEAEPLETTIIALVEFPSEEAVMAFAADPDYAPLGEARRAGSESRFRMLDDSDVAETISYLKKG